MSFQSNKHKHCAVIDGTTHSGSKERNDRFSFDTADHQINGQQDEEPIGQIEDKHSTTDESEIYDQDLKNFYSYSEIFPELHILKENYSVILEEMLAAEKGANWPIWPENHYVSQSREWRIFPFCYTFPASDASKTTWVDVACSQCPKTFKILQNLPNLRTALFSKLGPNTCLGAHRGWADLSNHILRVHLSLVVPKMLDGSPCCSMVVGNEAQVHEEGELIVFDDSKLHHAYNRHPEKTRVVLIVDMYRPDHIPRGRATGGHTDELDEFVQIFG
uniref:Uncharacterized protein AlNc14C36G3201 n=1 Tax=Albugo laibachii Nc14 TaxID=890382 RepID=F0W8S8_9STRA|nr:conserved hypothetical protein [Albugo laibachii Nc14]|eukprot:CCA17536.1 conserved hypothetical protein [Albugo laibachii Nc14]